MASAPQIVSYTTSSIYHCVASPFWLSRSLTTPSSLRHSPPRLIRPSHPSPQAKPAALCTQWNDIALATGVSNALTMALYISGALAPWASYRTSAE